VITSTVKLSKVGSVGRIVRLSVVGASKDTILAVLVQDIGIEELAKTRSNSSGSVAGVVCTLLGASSSADAGVEWLSHRKALNTCCHISLGKVVVQENRDSPI
jgi:hypothetical protein